MRTHTNKKHVIHLSREQRQKLLRLMDTPKLRVRTRVRLQALLLADESPDGSALTDAEINVRTQLSKRTIEWIRATFCESGLDGVTRWRGQSLALDGHDIDGAA